MICNNFPGSHFGFSSSTSGGFYIESMQTEKEGLLEAKHPILKLHEAEVT